VQVSTHSSLHHLLFQGPYPQLAVTVAIVLLFASLAALIFFLDRQCTPLYSAATPN
jgi:hypothetical protein